ncbi:hypothetical protein [Flavobacterium sp. B17]|uniref:hypothetical protein n=1 Tax=Flavobacterium sp. B17 TaxID=95618 RepID=UPI000349666D|nr:hypothetical protein [Flavobacterium sp. B17]
MKKTVFLFFISLSLSAFGQSVQELVKDLDGDSIKDTVRIDSDSRTIVCMLSTQKFKKIQSGKIQKLNFGNTLVATKKGFEFWNDFDRSGFRCVFEYDPKAKKMQLVQMRRIDDILSYDYGEKAKGKSSVNLLTGQYVGDFYKVNHGKLQKIPTIKTKMTFPKTYLETFTDSVCFDYEAKCLALYKKFEI